MPLGHEIEAIAHSIRPGMWARLLDARDARQPLKNEGQSEPTAPQNCADSPSFLGGQPLKNVHPRREEKKRREEELEPSTKRARTPTPSKRPFTMPSDWQPNAVNREWLAANGMPTEQQESVVAEFVRFAQHSELRKNERNWQLAFHRNPIVKKAIASAIRGNGHATHKHGYETPFTRGGRVLEEFIERECGVDGDASS
jgi:hypothetical protein